jgi:hypothetical protein
MYLPCQFIRYEIFLFLVSHFYVFCLAAGVLKTKYVIINVNIGNFRVCEGSKTLYTIKKISDFPIPSRDVTYQTLPNSWDWEIANFFSLVTVIQIGLEVQYQFMQKNVLCVQYKVSNQ